MLLRDDRTIVEFRQGLKADPSPGVDVLGY
jgi:hypothetical protein